MVAQVYDSRTNAFADVDSGQVAGNPVPPVEGDGDGKIFVSIATYRDGERCGETLKSIFENAKEPDRIVIGVIEQNDPEDRFCLEEYCKAFGAETYNRVKIRDGMFKLMNRPDEVAKCPRADQVRNLAFYHINAKGPAFARAMAKKILGNEEFCMQVDAHTSFAKNWDETALLEWYNAENEFGVITSVPPPITEKDDYSPGGSKEKQVPRQCGIKFRDNHFPDYESPADGYAENLEKPLLSHGWSAAFSFSKCHLEESAPYDPYLHYALPIEQFSRYARFWTRGYDTYTPTKNIVFHDYGVQSNGHGNNEWFKRQRARFRKGSIERVQTALQMPGGQTEQQAQANLGIYGVGKRRSLQQLQEFTNMNFQKSKGNAGESQRCSGAAWVPYDAKISPVENLFDHPDDLDPQPEFPMRTKMVYYQQVDVETTKDYLDVEPEILPALAQQLHHEPDAFEQHVMTERGPALPSFPLLFVFWILGLVLWCGLFTGSQGSKGVRPPRKKRSVQADADKQV